MSEFNNTVGKPVSSRSDESPGGRGLKSATRLALIVLAAQVSIAAAQDTAEQLPAIDISPWECQYCEFEEGWYTDVTLGIGYVAEDSYKFGEYNGLNEQGAYAIVDGDARYRGENATYLDLSVNDLGLDSRSLSIRGGRQGTYDVYLEYDEIPHYISDSAATPYRGNGSDRLTLPSGWVRAGSTAGMTSLDASLRYIELQTERKRIGTGVKITTESPWSYRVDVRRDDKQGDKRGGGTFFFQSAQLVEPVDYVTDEIDAAIYYSKKRWQASLGYYASTFTNGNEALRWDNAYNPIVAGADEGQLALPPDNEFQQVSLGVAYRIGERSHLSGDIAIGYMEQDEKLLQATINPSLVVPALPTDSADAEVETSNARIRFTTEATDRLSVSASYLYDDRDNKTEQQLYDWVTTDSFLASQRENLPYSYTRTEFELNADYDYRPGTRLGAGFERDQRERTFQEVDETDEDTLWASVSLRNIENLFVEFRLAFSAREASSYAAVPEIDLPQNALLRKYNMADRDRRSMSMFASYMPHADYSIGLQLDTASDDYDDSEIGLTEGRDSSINFDVTAILSEETSATAFIGRQKIDSSQSGSQTFSTPDWVAGTDDTFDVFGFGVVHELIEEELSIGLDLSWARSRGEIEFESGTPFPDLRSELETVKLHLDYRLDENLWLQATYWYETYDTSDWSLDGVDPDTVSNLLAFGEESPSYSNDVIAVSMSYRF